MVTLLDIYRQQQPQQTSTPSAPEETPWYVDLVDPQQSALGAFLQWMDRPGQVVRNVLRGELGSAGKQAVDFLGDTADAFLPGDLIGDLSTRDDYVSGSELVGLDESHWLSKLGADVAIGMATDPLTYLTFGLGGAANRVGQMARQAGRQAGEAAKLAPRTVQAADDAVDLLTRSANSARPATPEAQQLSGLFKQQADIDDKLSYFKADPKSMIDTPAPGNQALLEASKRDIDSQIASLLDSARSKELARAGDAAAKGAVKKEIESILEVNLTGSARRRLAKEGDQGIADFTRKVADEIGDDISNKNIDKVLSNYGDAFQQGGVRLLPSLGGTRIKAFDTVYDAAVSGINKGVDKLPLKGQDYLKRMGNGFNNAAAMARKAMGSGWFTAFPGLKAAHKAASSAGAATVESNVSNITKAFTGIDKNMVDATDKAVASVLDNIIDGRASGGSVELLVPRRTMGAISEGEIMSRIGELQRRMGEEAAGVDWDAVTRIVPELNRINKNMLDEGISLKMFDDAMEETVRGNDSYLFREYIGKVRDGTGNVTKSFNQADDLTQGLVDNLGGSSFNKGRSVRFEDDLVRFLNEQKDLMLEPSAFKRMIKRAERQGSAVTRAKIAQEVLGSGYTTLGASADPIMKIVGAMSETDPQFAQLLKAMTGTMRQRRGLFPLLAKVNKAFKPAAVYNLFIPKVASIPRNLIGGAWGAGSVIGYDEAMRQIKNMPRNMIDSLGVYWKQATRPLHGKKDVLDIHSATAGGVAEAIGETPEFGGRLGDDIRFVASMEGLPMDQRIAKAKERNPILAEAIEYGVLDGFVASEQLLKQHFRNRTLQNITDVATAPGAAFGHAEGAMRYATYKAMRESGISVKAARAMQEDAFLDYSVNFIENRTLRDLVPFAAFATGTIAQQSKLLAKRPAVGVAMAQLYGQNTDFPLMPWLQGTPSFSYGENEDGTPLVAAGLGLPFEALGLIPDISGDLRDLGSSARSGIVGSSHPLIKAGYGYLTGQDPFFGGPYGAYDKTPYSLQALGMSERSEFSRLYREISNTGLIQPLVSVINTFDRLLDPRMSLDAKAINLLTGMRIVANDPDNAAYRILQDRLAGDPTVRQQILYSGGSEEIDGVLKALRDAQKRRKEKREAKEEAKLAE